MRLLVPLIANIALVNLGVRAASNADIRIVTPQECIRYGDDFFERIWSDFEPLAAYGAITTSNVSDLMALATKMVWLALSFKSVASGLMGSLSEDRGDRGARCALPKST